jgi:DNA primase
MTVIDVAKILGLTTNRHISSLDTGFFYCPFHEETEESFVITISKNAYHCFSCGRHGSINKLSQELWGKPFSVLCNSDTKQFFNLRYKKEPALKKIIETPDFNVADMAMASISLQAKPEAYQYLTVQRKLSLEAIAYSDASFCLSAFYKPTFTTSNRIAFPLYYKDKLVSYEFRSYTPNAKPKVLYPPYTKKVVHGKNLILNDYLYIFEGLLDALSFIPISYNVTTTMGAISDTFLEDCGRFSKLVFAMDNDAGGVSHLKKIKEFYSKKGIVTNLYRLEYPSKYKDMNDILQRGGDIQELFKNGEIQIVSLFK